MSSSDACAPNHGLQQNHGLSEGHWALRPSYSRDPLGPQEIPGICPNKFAALYTPPIKLLLNTCRELEAVVLTLAPGSVSQFPSEALGSSVLMGRGRRRMGWGTHGDTSDLRRETRHFQG